MSQHAFDFEAVADQEGRFATSGEATLPVKIPAYPRLLVWA